MDLLSSLSIATGGLNALEYELSVTSQNVSNSGTTGYVAEVANVVSDVPGGLRNGVKVATTTLNINQALQTALYNQNASVASYTATSNSLAAVSAVQGTTSDSDSGSSDTLSDMLGSVRDALTSLTATPLDSGAQSTVISAAQALTTNIQTLSETYQTQRQTAEDDVVSTVSSINTNLTEIGAISKQIMTLKSTGVDTADLENQRLELMSSLSSQLSVTFSETSSGDMIVRTANGTELPTRPDQMGQNDNTVTLPSSTWPLSTSDTTVTPTMYYAAGDSDSAIPGITLGGKDITSDLTGGTLGADITLRDTTYPQMQAQLDSFSYTLINRFSSAGMSLFTNGTDATGTTVAQSSDPTTGTPNGIVGLSSTISVSQTYVNTPSLLTTATATDGTTTTGSTTLISTVLSDTFGTASTDVSGSLAAPSTGLGPDGTQSTGYTGAQGLIALATALTSNQGATISQATDGLTSATTTQTVIATSVSNVSGVNVNDEMSKVVALENAYTANAKVVTAVQSMFTALLDAID
ncbi:flagellar hook-associated protein FlgK [Acetobacter sp. TBRC 12305]|uniref:Flagellar hook-associated protein 1 n=1 Tax=Acetobacter garciniae TaxID=2817435 RepID=A0A939HM91_9PROT|nr:flagellar hook-associated protein FlgK [Acetobacter garciniae]MBO1324651.1 flagellar hook-associated protein FlgK [Acetobacter garciniae]MBX0344340.1 flagellar hook-associated protein FlgK [Acetobacter garciniae]